MDSAAKKRFVPTTGGFLRHRPERSEQRLNYEKLYQDQRALPKYEGVPKALRKKHVVGHCGGVRLAQYSGCCRS